MIPATPATPGGWTCGQCNSLVPYGAAHACGTVAALTADTPFAAAALTVDRLRRRVLQLEAALAAIVDAGDNDRPAYEFDPAFRAAVLLARQALGRPVTERDRSQS